MRTREMSRWERLGKIVQTFLLVGGLLTVVVCLALLWRETHLFEQESTIQDQTTTLSFNQQMDLLEKLKAQATTNGFQGTNIELTALIQLPDGVGKTAIEAFITKWQEKNWLSEKRRDWSNGKRSLLLYLLRNR